MTIKNTYYPKFIWMAWRWIRKILKAYPYFIFHYNFAYHLKKHAQSREIFYNMPYISADGPHVAKYSMINKLGSTEIRNRVSKFNPPIHKLDWKMAQKIDTEGMSLQDYLAFICQPNGHEQDTHCLPEPE